MRDLDDETSFFAALKTVPAAPSKDEDEPTFKGISVKYKPIVEAPPEPVDYEYYRLTKTLCTFDTETDPFLYGREPRPFWVGFYDGETYVEFWGDECIEQFLDYLLDRWEQDNDWQPVIYAHNGGKFDFHFLLDHIMEGEKPFMVNGRIVKINVGGFEFRDSFAIIPVAQGKFTGGKLKIDYSLFERDIREQHREEITKYAKHDVIKLHEIVSEYIERFGWRITVAGTALPYLRSFHGFNDMSSEHDQLIRSFYKGGRVQCFETGLIKGNFKMIDRNSMYPSAMKLHPHPVSAIPIRQNEITDETAFAYIEANNMGCLGTGDGLSFDFTVKRGKFFASIHEINAGIETGTLEIIRVINAFKFQHYTKFDTFVDYFYDLRLDSKQSGDTMGVELYKLMLNSAYGKLAMNTAHYKDWIIAPEEHPMPRKGNFAFETYTDDEGIERQRCVSSPDGWSPAFLRNGRMIFSKPARGAGQRFLNVATAASITGAARADLWRAICASKRVLYCDTDSIICEETSVELDDRRLGAWKIEATGEAVLIAGKKMYAFLSLHPYKEDSESVDIDGVRYYVIKKAHKGVTLTGTQIAEICRGGIIEHFNDAPSFGLDGSVKFTRRRVKMTATGDPSPQMELDLNGETAPQTAATNLICAIPGRTDSRHKSPSRSIFG